MWESLLTHALTTLITIFPIANPIGAVPIFYSLTAEDSPRFRHGQAKRTCIYVVLILTTFFVGGNVILSFFSLSIQALRVSGGLIIAHTAWEMVTTQQKLTFHEHQEAIDKEDVSLTPMAIPIVSGPAAIGLVIGLSTKFTYWYEIVGGILGILMLGGVLFVSLVMGEPLVKRWGQTGLGAMNRILGFLILAIAVQLVVDGLHGLW